MSTLFENSMVNQTSSLFAKHLRRKQKPENMSQPFSEEWELEGDQIS